MRTTGKRMLSILLCLCMAACMLPTVAFAADTGKAIQLGTDALSKEEAVTVERVQAMIDALPGAEEITEDNTEEVKAQLEAIDEAKAQLSDEELDQLDFSLYTEAASALGGLDKPMLTASTKKISVRMNAKNGKFTDSVSGGDPTAYGTTHTLTVTPQTGRYVIAGYFAGTDYYKTNPAKYQYSNMTLDKISEADPQTRAVQYQFTATEVIPIGNDSNYDYICLYFHCAKLPTLLWTFGNISGEATAPSTDGNKAAIPYVSQKELCGDPNEYTGYYSLTDKKDRPYLEWQVISITDKEGNTAGGTVAFDNNHLTYTPTADEAGKTVTITIRPKLGYVEEANTPLSFEIKVKKPIVEQSEFYVTMVIDGYGNAVAKPNPAKEEEEIQLTAIPDRGYHFKEWQATSGNIMITNDKFTMPAGNVTVKAIFEANTYTVKLEANGGTIASGQDVTSYTYGVGATLPTAGDMDYTGHTFKGWYDNEGLTGDPVTAIGGTETGNKAYWAKWTINQYTITFDTAGGSEIAPITQDYGTTITAPEAPAKSGYTFMGWSPALPATMPAENMTITAQWAVNQYTVTFDTAGGSEVAPITQDYGSNITAPADPTREGYTFVGWDKAIPATMPAENVTITAQWEINQYTITFDTAGGSEIAPITQDYGTQITAPANPTREGYTFIGWDKVIPETMPAENVTITAKWKVNQYTITFDTAGGSEIASITQNYGTAITAPADPTREGYTFLGWDKAIPATMPAENVTIKAKWKVNSYTITFDTAGGSEVAPITQDYGTAIAAPADPTREGYTFMGWDKAIPATMPAENVTIKAKWKVNSYTITFDTAGGSEIASITQNYGTAITAPADPTREGYTFLGWDKAIPATMPAENVTIKAKWKVNSYTITYDLDGGTAEGNPDTYTVETDAFTLKNPTRPGYTFTGWSGTGLTGDNNLTVTIPKGSTGDRSYTAHWRYNGGGGSGYSYYTIKATAGTGGSISPSGNVSVREGRDQTFTITPDKGYAVANVKIDGKSIGAVKSYTFENVRRTHTIEVIFMKANGNPQTGVFVDVATGSYYEDAVDWAVGNGITQGTDDTHFSPDGICTRAQAVTFLWRTAGSPKPETRTMPFADVPAGSYYYDAVLWAVENGITKGTSDTTFSPDATCSRAQIVTFLWRSEKSPAAGTANPFADVKSTAYYADAVLWAVKEDITMGSTNTTFSPDADCTRAQIVTFLWRCKK